MDAVTLAAANAATRKSRRNLLRRLSVVRSDQAFPPVMSSPPTRAFVAPGGSNPITSAVEVPYKSGLFTTLGGALQLEGATYTNYGQPKENASNNGAWTAGVTCLEFDYWSGQTTPSFALRFRNTVTNGARVWLWVDGQPASTGAETNTAVASTSAAFYQVTFAAPGHHRIRIFTHQISIGGIEIGPTDAIAPVRAPAVRAAWLGDSWVEGTGANTAQEAMPSTVGRLLGVEMATLGQGGTGYANAATGAKATYADSLRLSNLISLKPDVVIVSGSSNDDALSTATVAANAATVFSTIRTGLPNALLFVVGPPVLTSIPAGRLANRDAIKAACVAAGGVFIDQFDPRGLYGTSAAPAWAFSTTYNVGDTVSGSNGVVYEARTFHTSASSGGLPASTWMQTSWFTGTGKITAPTGSGNGDFFINSDATHPSQAGHEFLARAIAEWIVRYVNTLL